MFASWRCTALFSVRILIFKKLQFESVCCKVTMPAGRKGKGTAGKSAPAALPPLGDGHELEEDKELDVSCTEEADSPHGQYHLKLANSNLVYTERL